MWANIAQLITLTSTTDSVGDLVETETQNQVFCNELSVSQTEFYQAMATGLKPEVKIEINRFEYNNEKKVLYNSVKYEVIRTYAKNTEIIELTLGGGINGTT